MFVFQHVVGSGSCDLLSILVLTKVVHEVAVWSNKIHDDGVVNLEMENENTCSKNHSNDCTGMGGGHSYQVIVIIVRWSHTVVDPVSFGHLVYLLLSAGESQEPRVEL